MKKILKKELKQINYNIYLLLLFVIYQLLYIIHQKIYLISNLLIKIEKNINLSKLLIYNGRRFS